MPIEVKEFRSGRLVRRQIVREDDPEYYLNERFEIFDSFLSFNLKVYRKPGMLVVKHFKKWNSVYWKKVENEPVWSFGNKYYHYYPVDNGIRWNSETTIYKAI
tara:strand:+ start:2269 stop:2577 length:309 start_codon:yes stop_codon:yes gene_type:complete